MAPLPARRLRLSGDRLGNATMIFADGGVAMGVPSLIRADMSAGPRLRKEICSGSL